MMLVITAKVITVHASGHSLVVIEKKTFAHCSSQLVIAIIIVHIRLIARSARPTAPFDSYHSCCPYLRAAYNLLHICI